MSEIFVLRITQHGDVVHEGFEPNVHDLLGVTWDRDAPADFALRAADADVLETFGNHTENLVATVGRHYLERAVVYGLLYPWRVLAEFEEIVFFLDLLVGAVVVGADTLVLLHDCLGEEGFVAGTVPTLVCTLIDIILEVLPDQLRALFMTFVCSADEPIVADVQ